jgi:hypothetical protein
MQSLINYGISDEESRFFHLAKAGYDFIKKSEEKYNSRARRLIKKSEHGSNNGGRAAASAAKGA